MIKKLVYGVGVNDISDKTELLVDGKRTPDPYYRAWSSMLSRCYQKSLLIRCKTYAGCSVCDEWLYFSNFKRWMTSQNWKGKQLDKDILVAGNKIYSPSTCVFVDRSTNMLISDSAASRGEFPIGVSRSYKGYRSMCSKDGENQLIGTYGTPEEAGNEYKKFKSLMLLRGALMQSDERVKLALASRAGNMIESTY